MVVLSLGLRQYKNVKKSTQILELNKERKIYQAIDKIIIGEEGKIAVYHHSSGIICIPYMVMTDNGEEGGHFSGFLKNFCWKSLVVYQI